MSRCRPGPLTLRPNAPPPSAAQIFLSMVVISAVLTLGFRYKVREFKAKHHYVSAQHVRSEATQTFFIFWGFLVLLSVMVPMAMFIL